MFHQITGNLEKNAGNRGHNIIFFPLLFLIVTLKRAQKSNWGKIYDIFSPVSLFFPLRPCNNCSTFTDGVLGENMARGKSNHTMFPKIMGNLEKKSRQEGTLYYIFPPTILIVTLKRAQKFNWGKIYDNFSPCVFLFSSLSHAIIVLLLQTVYWGKNMARGKSNHIFPAGHNLFCDGICVFQLGENI